MTSPKATVGDGGLVTLVMAAIRRMIRAIDIHSRYLATHYGLTGPQLVLLNELSRRQTASISELARGVHLGQATVTGIVDRLERRGLVQRERGSLDKRKVFVALTTTGEEMLAHAPTPLQAQFTEAFGQLADWEQTQILSSVQRLVAMMEATGLEATPMLTTGPVDAPAAKSEQADSEKQTRQEGDVPDA